MPLTTAMRDLFAKFTTTEDSSAKRFGSTMAWIHVGSSTSAFLSSQNAMLSTSASDGNAKGMNAGFPKRNDGTCSTADNILIYQATFTSSEANFAWEEWGIKNASATTTSTTNTLMNRVVGAALGTKTSAQAWQFSAQITLST